MLYIKYFTIYWANISTEEKAYFEAKYGSATSAILTCCASESFLLIPCTQMATLMILQDYGLRPLSTRVAVRLRIVILTIINSVLSFTIFKTCFNITLPHNMRHRAKRYMHMKCPHVAQCNIIITGMCKHFPLYHKINVLSKYHDRRDMVTCRAEISQPNILRNADYIQQHARRIVVSNTRGS